MSKEFYDLDDRNYCAVCGRNGFYMEYRDGSSGYVCVRCLEKAINLAFEDHEEETYLLKRERRGILLGMLVGIIISAIVVYLYINNVNYILTYVILFPIWITFTCGSFATIVRTIKGELKRGEFVINLIVIIGHILMAPMFTSGRLLKIFQEIHSIKKNDKRLETLLENVKNDIKIRKQRRNHY